MSQTVLLLNHMKQISIKEIVIQMGKEILKAKKKSHMEERTFNLLASLMEYPPRSMVSPDS